MSLGNSASLTSDSSTKRLFKEILTRGGFDGPQNFERLAVAEIARHTPRAMMVDLDHLKTDRLECVRQLRFVLPECIIAVVSSELQGNWAARCHLAGATGVLSRSAVPQMVAGLLRAVRNGCYTDPSFMVPASDG
jgi:DNA-binding NarL/FixJ family response regulator